MFEQHRKDVFADTLYFNARDVRTAQELACFDKLKAGMNPRYELHLAMYDEEKLIGWSSSFQVSVAELYMMNSAIMPEYRRQGYYTTLMNKVIEKAKEKGFQQITSQHLASNNAVIIPKLTSGFQIVGTEVSDQYGVFVKLAYYLNETRRDMYYFRTGAIHPSEEMLKILAKSKSE